MSKVALNVEMEVVQCGECGGAYALSARYVRQKRENGGYWTCPYCECGWGYGKSELSRVKNELDKAKRDRDWYASAERRARERADHEAARAAGFKGALTRAKKRVGRGVCPCCNRSFGNLRDHMATQHPEYADGEVEETCGAATIAGTPCTRPVHMAGHRCWQHA